MKRLVSILLAAVMLTAMLPAAALPAAGAGEAAVQAYYTAEAPTMDGQIKEPKWALTTEVGQNAMGFLCSETTLYIGLRARSRKTQLTINGAAVEIDAATGVISVGTLAVGSGTAEAAIPLSKLGLTGAAGESCSFSCTVDGQTVSGRMTLAARAMAAGDDFDDISVKAYATKLGSSSGEVYAESAEGGLRFRSGTMSADGAHLAQPSWALPAAGFDQSQGFTLEFTADFNDLTVPNDQAGYAALTGLAFDVRGADWQQRYGFHADESGNIIVTQYETSAAATAFYDTGLDLPAAGAQVRIEVSAEHASEVYVNGARVATFEASARKPSESTRNTVSIYNSTRYRGGDKRGNDVLLYEFLLTQSAPTPKLTADMIDAAGAISVDGQLDEGFWSPDVAFEGGELGALCDRQNLYLALRTQSASAVLTIDGVPFKCTLGGAPAVSTGSIVVNGVKIAGKGGVYELSVPLASLGLSVDNASRVDVTARADGEEKALTLVLPGETLSAAAMAGAPAGSGSCDAEAFLNVAELVLDGKPNEPQWYLACPAGARSGSAAPAANAGFAWDRENLYLGVQVVSLYRLRSAALTVGGRTVNADLSAGTVDAGKLAQGRQQLEWAIPLSALGLTGDVGAGGDYTLTLTGAGGVSGLSGKLTLSGRSAVLADVCTAADKYTVISSVTGTTWTPSGDHYAVATDPGLTGNEIYQMYAPVKFEGGAYELVLDAKITSLPSFTASLGWRGLCFELRQPTLQTRFNFRNDGRGGIVMDVLYSGSRSVAADTGVKLGQRAVYKVTVDEKLIPRLYVNDKLIEELPALDRTEFTISDTYPMPRVILQAVNHNRTADADGKLSGVNAELYDLLFTQSLFKDASGAVESALDSLTDLIVLNGNDPDDLTDPLTLTGSLTLSELGRSFPVTWKTTDALTGRTLDAVDLKSGAVTKAEKPVLIQLTATVTADGKSVSKSFGPFQIRGTGVSKVFLLVNDDDPRVGRPGAAEKDRFVYLDTDHSSLVFDQGAKKQFNRITLYDSDDFSRTSLNDLGVFVSDDGAAWTKLSGFQLHQSGSAYILYNLDASARYVKVHCYQDDLDREGIRPSFYNALSALMSVSMESDWLGAKGAFAHSAEYQVSAASSAKDAPVHITAAQLGAKAGEYRADGADFRFTLDGKLLAHYYDGQGGFWVRVPAVPATITALWGNAGAEDISDGEATFQTAYGNVSLIDMSAHTPLKNSGRAFTFPKSGDVIVVAKSGNQDLAMIRSTDGGRTFDPEMKVLIPKSKYNRPWGFGSYLYDEERNRLYLIAYSVSAKSDDSSVAEGRMALMYTEDDGKTWSKERFLTDASATPVGTDDYIIKNSQGRLYALTYCDGLKLKDADGPGPNVDYVITHSFQSRDGVFEATALYSSDGGETWTAGTGTVSMETTGFHEAGISETGFAQLDDGTLYIVARAQEDSNHYLYQAFSKDFGETWYDVGPSRVISTNTSPVLSKYTDRERILMWAGNNSLGGNARRRMPMSLGLSTDQYKSYDKIIDLTFGTSWDTLLDATERMTQPSISYSPDKKEAFVCWTNLRQDPKTTVGFLVEEFDEMLHGTKGAFDDFETTSLKSEGWLRDVNDTIEVTEERALSGRRSMKITDASGTYPSYATRQVPSMKKGTVGVSLFVPSTNKDEILTELKAGYNFVYLQHALAAFSVSPDGTVSVCTDSGKSAAGKVATDTWNDFAVSFDIAAGTGRLLINGKAAADFKLMAKGDEVTAVEISDPSASKSVGTCVYVDDFYAAETAELALTRHCVHKFDDVAADAWYKNAVDFAYTNGIMSGYSATTFGPNNTLSRAMVVQVLYNKEGKPDLGGATHSFPDVPKDQWYNNAVTWGAAKKVVAGYGSGLFGPDNPVSVEQVAVILWNYSGTPAGSGDISSLGGCSDWAANALKWAVEKGILNGVPVKSVTGSATRAQTAQMLMNYLKK